MIILIAHFCLHVKTLCNCSSLQVHQLEAEKSQLEASIQLTDKHHKQQVETLETSHRDYISLLEETSRRRETRLLQEAEGAAARSEDRIQAVLAERSKVVSEHQARMEQGYSEHSRELEKLKQVGMPCHCL